MTPLNSASNTPLFFWITLALIILVACTPFAMGTAI